MVLESIFDPKSAEQRPWQMFFVGMLYSSFAILLSMYLFIQYAGLTMIFFTVAASIPIIYRTIKWEEKKDLEINDEKMLIKEHGKALSFFVFLFLGFVVSFAMWYAFLPAETSEIVFEIQSDTIRSINGHVTGNAYSVGSAFVAILMNNIKVLIFCLIFAFFYGAGAIYILTWNAGVIAVALVDFIRSNLGAGIGIIPLALLRYMTHGIPEILAYFMGGLAGGIISIAIIRHDFRSDKARKIVVDSLDLTFGAVAMLVVAALLEVFVSPLFY